MGSRRAPRWRDGEQAEELIRFRGARRERRQGPESNSSSKGPLIKQEGG